MTTGVEINTGTKRRVDGVGAHSDRAGYRCAHADVAGHAPDPLRQTFAAPRFASIPDLKVLALRVEPASGRDDASVVQRPLRCAFNSAARRWREWEGQSPLPRRRAKAGEAVDLSKKGRATTKGQQRAQVERRRQIK